MCRVVFSLLCFVTFSFSQITAEIGKQAPFFRMPNENDPNRSIIQISEWYSGVDRGPVTVVAFWASWCAPCYVELPWFQSYLDGLDDVRLVAVSVDSAWGTEQVEALEKMEFTLPVIHDTYGLIASRYLVGQTVPVTAYIGRDGVLRELTKGFTISDTTEIKKRIESLLD